MTEIGTELGITTSLSRRRIELPFVQGISLAGDNSALGGLSGHQELADLNPPVVAPRIRLPRTLVFSMQGIEANRFGPDNRKNLHNRYQRHDRHNRYNRTLAVTTRCDREFGDRDCSDHAEPRVVASRAEFRSLSA